MSSEGAKAFIARWAAASASERANSQPFLCGLCDILGVALPEPTRETGYAFEYEVTEHHPDGSTTKGRIDLYKRGFFVLESKQFQAAKAAASQLELAAQEAGVIEKKKFSQPVRGTEAWDGAMVKARGQAERYVRALPPSEPNPPFLLVVDVGHSFEVFADFTQAGKAYLPFPDPRTFRIRLEHLADEKVRERLKLIWTHPSALDPALQSADVTREISAHLAELAKSLEEAGHKPRVVADSLTRCLFCMFAEDVGLLPERSFTDLLNSLPADGSGFQELVEQLFREMNSGTGKGISIVLRKKLLQFNGGLFSDFTVLPVNGLQLGLLKEAAKQNWSHVEPAIFGTLLERALNPGERHKLGAHYTRAYVERLVLPTVVEPLRAEWESVRAAAFTHARAGNLKAARDEVNAFHDKLCRVMVLDPACGCGNFLYVSLEHLKRLEGEILDVGAQFGESFKLELETHSVDPHQFLGLEINPRAAAITELVLWIGYLQWHFRTRGQTMPAEPVLRKFKNIECRDAVLAYDGEPEPARDAAGNLITVWDRKSMKKDTVTGRDVPDETKRVPLLIYKHPRPAEWPIADYVVGNPPFLGKLKLRQDLGDGYAEALRQTYPGVPESVDFVVYWWYKAAKLARAGSLKRFGLITTNSLSQTFSSRLVRSQLEANPPLSLLFAIPDHPWVDTAEGAAVRIAMTVGTSGSHLGELLEVTNEQAQAEFVKVDFTAIQGRIQADLSIGADVLGAQPLSANQLLAGTGLILGGRGFVLNEDEANSLKQRNAKAADLIFPLRNGEDINGKGRNLYVIDTDGWSEADLRLKAPEIFQRLRDTVYTERQSNRDPRLRKMWWLFRRSNEQVRAAIAGLSRFIATAETSKHRTFTFLDAKAKPEHKLVVVGSSDAYTLGVLSSRIHVVYALAAGGWLGVGNDPVYSKSRCFDPFPFPACDTAAQDRIRKIAEELDAHRKCMQSQNPGLTLTRMYNVLERLRANEALNAKEKQIHDAGLVSVLRQLHDDLDAAVFAAYGWPPTLTDAEILERLVALNAQRAKEEASGLVRWLRPDYQNPGGPQPQQTALAVEVESEAKSGKQRAGKLAWPKTLSERVKAVSSTLAAVKEPLSATEIAKRFARARATDVGEILDTLCAMGKARRGPPSTEPTAGQAKAEGTFLP
jgi:hypothetical protein